MKLYQATTSEEVSSVLADVARAVREQCADDVTMFRVSIGDDCRIASRFADGVTRVRESLSGVQNPCHVAFMLGRDSEDDAQLGYCLISLLAGRQCTEDIAALYRKRQT